MTGRTSAKLPATTQSSADVAPAARAKKLLVRLGTPIRPPIKLVKFNVLRAEGSCEAPAPSLIYQSSCNRQPLRAAGSPRSEQCCSCLLTVELSRGLIAASGDKTVGCSEMLGHMRQVPSMPTYLGRNGVNKFEATRSREPKAGKTLLASDDVLELLAGVKIHPRGTAHGDPPLTTSQAR